ncbi:hypothetical protein KSS87_012031 [Heliosperma pusillum]|nr:hypothetical protein KSS87_012031 [Heliosperma pusillum]
MIPNFPIAPRFVLILELEFKISTINFVLIRPSSEIRITAPQVTLGTFVFCLFLLNW